MRDETLDAAWIAYRDDRLDEGLQLARDLVRAAPADGRCWYVLACLQERAGRLLQADRSFQRAGHARVEPCAPPCRIDARRFDAALTTARDHLPPQFAEALAMVQVLARDYPTPTQVQQFDEIELLGLFEGPTRAELGTGQEGFGTQPLIWIFRRPHEHATSTIADLRAEVTRTFLHEFGHFMGFDEEGVDRMGLQ